MITYRDKSYIQTKEIMQGKIKINPEYENLIKFISDKYGVKPINIVYDKKNNSLEICLEYQQDILRFLNKNGLNYDHNKQNSISKEFKKNKSQKRTLINILAKLKLRNEKSDSIRVYYSAFEPIAQSEANENVSLEQLMNLKNELNFKYLWEISRLFSGATFFLYTEKQVKQYEKSEVRKKWAEKYFKLLEPYDEFGYFKRDKFNIYLDSKENFDKNYNSSWFYYYR